ncbi:MAG: outer membrane beta-barrel family protein [Tannerella sp.]|jgi:hypothetical protein|nr:outer membrane beta-barrel family protein [Tannerella sp.]
MYDSGSFGSFDISRRKSLFNRKITATLAGSDLFLWNRYHSKMQIFHISMDRYMKYDSRAVSLTVAWNFTTTGQARTRVKALPAAKPDGWGNNEMCRKAPAQSFAVAFSS